jgi:hypothetical protein
MITDEDLESRQKIAHVKGQILKARMDHDIGGISVIECPYCNMKNYEGNELCCKLLRDCVITILMGLRQDQIESKVGRHVN